MGKNLLTDINPEALKELEDNGVIITRSYLEECIKNIMNKPQLLDGFVWSQQLIEEMRKSIYGN